MVNPLHKLGVSSKLWTISLAYSLPIAVLLYLMIAGFNKDIQFSQMELYGNAYQRPLELVLELIPQNTRQLTHRKVIDVVTFPALPDSGSVPAFKQRGL